MKSILLSLAVLALAFSLSAGTQADFRFIDETTGEALTNLNVTLAGPGGMYEVCVGANCEASFAEITPGWYQVQVVQPGCATAWTLAQVEADAYQHLKEKFGMTQDEIAERVGKDRTTVSNAMRKSDRSHVVL